MTIIRPPADDSAIKRGGLARLLALLASANASRLKFWHHLFIKELETSTQHFSVGGIGRHIDRDQIRHRLPLPRGFDPFYRCCCEGSKG